METGDFKPYNGTLAIKPLGALRHGPLIVIPTKDSVNQTLYGNTKYTYLLNIPKDLGSVTQSSVRLVAGPEALKTDKVAIKSIAVNYLSARDPA